MALPRRVEADPLVLRAYEVEDAPALIALVTANLDHLRPWMPWIQFEPVALVDREHLIRQWEAERQADANAVYGMFVGDELVGGTGLHSRIGPGGLEIGYWVGRAHEGRGYATIASRALTEVALALPGITRVEIRHDVANERSGRVPERLGFTLVDDVACEVVAPGETGVKRIWRQDPPGLSGSRSG